MDRAVRRPVPAFGDPGLDANGPEYSRQSSGCVSEISPHSVRKLTRPSRPAADRRHARVNPGPDGIGILFIGSRSDHSLLYSPVVGHPIQLAATPATVGWVGPCFSPVQGSWISPPSISCHYRKDQGSQSRPVGQRQPSSFARSHGHRKQRLDLSPKPVGNQSSSHDPLLQAGKKVMSCKSAIIRRDLLSSLAPTPRHRPGSFFDPCIQSQHAGRLSPVLPMPAACFDHRAVPSGSFVLTWLRRRIQRSCRSRAGSPLCGRLHFRFGHNHQTTPVHSGSKPVRAAWRKSRARQGHGFHCGTCLRCRLLEAEREPAGRRRQETRTEPDKAGNTA